MTELAHLHLIRSVVNPLDNYRIEQTIGKGTFGKVYLGFHRPTGQKVAVKILEKDKIVDPGDFTRIKREIHILRKIQHPQIVHLYEILESETKIYLVMEFIEGGELFQRIVKQKRLLEFEASKHLSQILMAVEYLHSKKIAHRDLKPENILLTEDQQIKIVDFGLSNIYTDLLNTPCGSPCYAAPEMISGLAYNGAKTDTWACGVILYAMLCGCVPFEDTNTKKLYEKIKYMDFHKPPFLSPVACDLLHGLLNKNPDQRLTLAQIKSHPFLQGQINGIKLHINVLQKPNEEIIKLLVEQGIEEYKCKDMIVNNKHNSITTTYYLLRTYFQKQEALKKKVCHQSTKSNIPISSISSERIKLIPQYHSKNKSTENNNRFTSIHTSENKRIATAACDQIKVQTYLKQHHLRERNRTQYSQDYSSFRQSLKQKPVSGSETKRQNSRSPQLYVEYLRS